MRLVIASRQSDLARLQALQVAAELRRHHPQIKIEHHFRESLGDREQENPLWQMPTKGVFTEDFAAGLQNQEFDLVVHSWKDLPTEERPHSHIAATLPRADARDVLLVRKDVFAQTLSSWRVMSSSPRRAHFLGQAWSKLCPAGTPAPVFQAVRGNIPTRLLKLQQGHGEALLVAKAALDRLLQSEENEFQQARMVLRQVLDDCRWMVLPLSIQPPAPAQGALAIEIKKNRPELERILSSLHCTDTFANVQWERQQLSAFGGGCHLKLGALAQTREQRKLRIVKGLPPSGAPVNQMWIERKTKGTPLQENDLCVLRSSDLFHHQMLSPVLTGDAFYIAHARALTAVRPPTGTLLWTAGLQGWAELAKQGLWVNGTDESWGESLPNVQALAGRTPHWQKMTHSRAGDSILPSLATYSLENKNSVATDVAERVAHANFFFWRSGTLFERAWELWPSLRQAKHACGLGSTRLALEKKLGSLGEDQVFLDEAEWRMFYGAAYDELERTF